jgi:hypothetical protein
LLELRSQPGILAGRRRESMPKTLLGRADAGRPLMQLTAPGRARLAVDDELADRISELDLPTKLPVESRRSLREQSGLGDLG